MRNTACEQWRKLFRDQPFVFLTGDLGFAVLEPLQVEMGPRFINAGVAEQNAVSVAAGLASEGLGVWFYSISPFTYARPFEQIRNDICLHDLPVKLVGNGGGYAYGVMGPSHHAIEDYGALLGLQNMHVFVPAFAADLAHVVPALAGFAHPAYLRLGRCELPADFVLPPYAPWRRLLDGDGATLVVVGPLAGSIVALARELPRERRPDLWVVSELPGAFDPLPEPFVASVAASGRLVVAEEHVAHGSVGHRLVAQLAEQGHRSFGFEHRCARGYPSGRYGSQGFHRCESGLAPEDVLACAVPPELGA